MKELITLSYKCDCKECIIRNLFFKHLKEEEIDTLCKSKVEKFLKEGQTILKEEIHNTYLAYLKSGLVKYYTEHKNGKNHIITIVKPYESVSLLSIFNNTNLSYNISALEDSILCLIPLKIIKEFIFTNSEFSFDYINSVTTIANRIIERFLTLNIKNLKGRIAFVLLEFADEIYKSDSFKLPITRREIGEMIGMTTENVIRTLSEFHKEKLIKITGKEVTIIEKEKLRKISLFG